MDDEYQIALVRVSNWMDESDEIELRLAREEVNDLPPLVQDTVALARIDAEALTVPYPLLNEDRREAGLWRLFAYFWRLVWWRWRSRRSL